MFNKYNRLSVLRIILTMVITLGVVSGIVYPAFGLSLMLGIGIGYLIFGWSKVLSKDNMLP